MYDAEFRNRGQRWGGRASPFRGGRYDAEHRYGRGPEDGVWFGGYGGQGEEARYMRYYGGQQGPRQGGGGRRPRYEDGYGPHTRPNPGREEAWNYGGYGGFYRQWGESDGEGRKRPGRIGS